MVWGTSDDIFLQETSYWNVNYIYLDLGCMKNLQNKSPLLSLAFPSSSLVGSIPSLENQEAKLTRW